MTSIVITGANGFIGRLLAARLAVGTQVTIDGQPRTIGTRTLVDRFIPDEAADDPQWIRGDLGALIAERPDIFTGADVVLHLASAVSGECEADLDLGLNANLFTGIALGRCLAATSRKPMLVFASSLAIYGGTPDQPLADLITDATRPTPQNSYGAQKLMLEEFYADLARRGMISSRSVRLMTVSVRPGKPNAAASSFLSGMIREPLQGEPANVPVDTALRVVLNSPTGAVDGLMHAMSVTDDEWGAPLGLNLPGISVTVGEMVEALREVGGEEAVARLSFDRDEAIERIVSGWPTAAQSERAARLGFAADRPFIAAVRDFAASLERN
ncbi:MAG: NAD-dependent epimerase/dehydratase family protein [Rhodobiaceae bacterium]